MSSSRTAGTVVLLSLFLLSEVMRRGLLTLRVCDWLMVKKTSIWKNPYVTSFLWRIQGLYQDWVCGVYIWRFRHGEIR